MLRSVVDSYFDDDFMNRSARSERCMGVFGKKDGEGLRKYLKPGLRSIVEKPKVGFRVVELFDLLTMTQRLPADDFVTANDVLDVDILAMAFQKCSVESSALIARDNCEEPLAIDCVLAIRE